jgi:hypothetical protein
METSGAQLLEAEPFVELFADHAVYLGAYTRADAESMVSDLLVRRGAVMSASAIDALIYCTGGHPGLLRAALSAFIDRPVLASIPAAGLSPALLTLAGVAQECAAIWGSLSPGEQQALLARHSEARPASSSGAELLLHKKRLLGDGDATFPPVFAAFVASGAAG